MPSINLDLDYFSHPKTLRLVAMLGNGAELAPIRLWCHCGKFHKKTGELKDYSESEIEGICGWVGERGKLVEALLATKFISKNRGGWMINDWSEHNGHLEVFEKRARDAAQIRWSKYRAEAPQPIKKSSPPPPPKKEKKVPVGYQDLVAHMLETFKAKKKIGYPFTVLEGSVVKRLLYLYDLNQMKALWDVFLALDDDWIRKVGHSIPEFQRCIPSLLDKSDWKERTKKYEQAGPALGLAFHALPQAENFQEKKMEAINKLSGGGL